MSGILTNNTLNQKYYITSLSLTGTTPCCFFVLDGMAWTSIWLKNIYFFLYSATTYLYLYLISNHVSEYAYIQLNSKWEEASRNQTSRMSEFIVFIKQKPCQNCLAFILHTCMFFISYTCIFLMVEPAQTVFNFKCNRSVETLCFEMCNCEMFCLFLQRYFFGEAYISRKWVNEDVWYIIR